MADTSNALISEELVVEEIPEVEIDPDHPLTRAVQAQRQRSITAKRNAQAMRRAADGWAAVSTDTDWERVVDQAGDDYTSGAFLLNQLGGEGSLDPLAHAEPLEQATPARSSAIARTWPSRPANAIHDVCGSRGAHAPWTINSGQAASSSRSNWSRTIARKSMKALPGRPALV